VPYCIAGADEVNDMKSLLINATVLLLLLGPGANKAFTQTKKSISSCKQTTFAAFKPLPKLTYECPTALIESDDKILKLPERIAGINKVTQQLRALANPAWWQTNVDDLNACEIHGSAGALTDEEKTHFRDLDYQFMLFGNQQIRVVVVRDPCYQAEYNGSNLFVLYRTGGKVFVTEVIDGFFSRADSFLDVDFANLDSEQLIEVSTASGSLHPYVARHYFVIDKMSHKAVPRNLIKEGMKLTNLVTSVMLLSELKDLGLPQSAGELQIIRRHRLAPSFSVYDEDERGRINDNGRKLRRIIYRWNGRFYAPR
jgi:hypothetical protein